MPSDSPRPAVPIRPANLDRHRRVLIAERASLVDRLAVMERDAASWLASEPLEDAFDEEGGEGSAITVELANEAALRTHLMASLDEVDAALRSIDAGTYGRCTACGQPIADGRLEALPTARECVACKSAGPLRRRSA